MERFVRVVVGGGLALVAGLWATALSPAGTEVWLSGVLLAALGTIGLAVGIRSQIAY